MGLWLHVVVELVIIGLWARTNKVLCNIYDRNWWRYIFVYENAVEVVVCRVVTNVVPGWVNIMCLMWQNRNINVNVAFVFSNNIRYVKYKVLMYLKQNQRHQVTRRYVINILIMIVIKIQVMDVNCRLHWCITQNMETHFTTIMNL